MFFVAMKRSDEYEKENTIEVLVVEPMKRAEFKIIEENPASMQEIAGGNNEEYMHFEDEVAIVCNEEGKLRGLETDRGIEKMGRE